MLVICQRAGHPACKTSAAGPVGNQRETERSGGCRVGIPSYEAFSVAGVVFLSLGLLESLESLEVFVSADDAFSSFEPEAQEATEAPEGPEGPDFPA